MVGAVSGMNAYYNVYGAYGPHSAAQARGAQDAEGAKQAQGTPALWAARRSASPETPVQPVAPVRAVDGEESQPVRLGPTLREGADPAEMAVRMRITPYKENAPEEVRQKSQDGNDLKVGAEGAQAAAEEGKCQTCEERKYQDESDDMGVSFQTATNIAPEQAASAVRGHENEHVVREQAKAQREDRREGRPSGAPPVGDTALGYLYGMRKGVYFRRHDSDRYCGGEGASARSRPGGGTAGRAEGLLRVRLRSAERHQK